MGRKRKGASMTREEVAALIEDIADRIASGDQSFEIQLPITTAQEALLELRHIEGLKLLNRVGLLHLMQNGTKDVRYDYIRREMEELTPLDVKQDSATLRD